MVIIADVPVGNITFSVKCTVNEIHDPYGTGDSPLEYDVYYEYISVDYVDLNGYLKESIMEKIDEKVIELYKYN